MLNRDRCHVSKGWGYEDWIVNTSLYCGKLLFIKKDKKLSLHYHDLKDETFYVQSGQVCLTYYDNPVEDDNHKEWSDSLLPWPGWHKMQPGTTVVRGALNQIILNQGDSFHIPIGRRHTLFGLLDSNVFEFSTQHFDSDSLRILKGD